MKKIEGKTKKTLIWVGAGVAAIIFFTMIGGNRGNTPTPEAKPTNQNSPIFEPPTQQATTPPTDEIQTRDVTFKITTETPLKVSYGTHSFSKEAVVNGPWETTIKIGKKRENIELNAHPMDYQNEGPASCEVYVEGELVKSNESLSGSMWCDYWEPFKF